MPATSEVRGEAIAVSVWDLPVRTAHWLLVLLVALSWFTGKNGALAWHRWSGYAIICLVLFRIYWGFAGSSTARFSHFLRGPRAVREQLRKLLERNGHTTAGHTAIGGWSIVIMLSLLLTQAGFGLFAVDVDGIESGPLADLVTFHTGRSMAWWHGKVVDILLLFIALHLAAVLHYWIYKRENLIPAMITGSKRLPPGTKPVSVSTFWRAALGLAVAALVVFALVTRLWL